ncbi:hypothetical protein NNJEOMEG_01985 [Fundidesulfovibrio magnetotacticus]|uniref:MORN repeat protein n=1 Tax=Fundidesulfovibrio magnetotacticus TaxID=2730080 RepID=A0A6V8LWG2_9BACT|nr:hypothetical protein [Fundidesulfovibrio magnetotacticus]GFK94146.1 hypothetical protein NNJEOMEG_01985 [Fundidesulfovibrio magnetotacticus]
MRVLFLLLLLAFTAVPARSMDQPSVSPEEMEERGGLIHKAGDNAPFTGLVRDLHASGKPRLEARYEAGRLAWSRLWYESGQLAEEVAVAQDTWTIKRYAENGRIEEETVARFRDGRKFSEQSRLWDESGVLRTEAGFQGGKLQGPLKEYAPDGALVRDEVYEQGKLVRKNK